MMQEPKLKASCMLSKVCLPPLVIANFIGSVAKHPMLENTIAASTVQASLLMRGFAWKLVLDKRPHSIGALRLSG